MLGVLLGYLFLQMILRDEPEEQEAAAQPPAREPADLYHVRRAG